MQREPGKVSIVITNYNRAAYLIECLNSLKQQSYVNTEIVFVDDASTDRSVDIVQAWCEENGLAGTEAFVLVRMPRNVGFSGAVTTGLFVARGEFIAVQDADDFSHPQRLEKQVSYLRNHPEIALVGASYATFEDAEDENKRVFEQAKWLRYGEDIRKVYQNGGHCVCHGTIMFKGAAFDLIGGLSRRIVGAEDYEFIVKFLHNKDQIANIPEILYYYRQHASQRSLAYYPHKE
ncbi:glycosyltransferase involved in cell wall biosynthesis [Paenibacillus endophyticus]|uniref:Glycosyltransferase involved in cell wall biosynthesis n=1 Tax=Paenibacillus endophyticus TaxID=1294268 RepID=A0A7W5GBS2_9BACL|nr:glycosyltransferase family 2 protein [Paenibacillus endophyticus]MBB3154120.1 glycosyltransferase involved in cell wall biosynthesis [Paenibacillus endophyticus]